MRIDDSNAVVVWDPFVRVAHWTLAAAFFVAYLTEEPLALHVWSGYIIGALVILRVIWGFVGPRHARFADFAYSPRLSASYFFDLLRGRAQRYIGHSPAGAAMVFALLLSLAATVGTGLVVYAQEKHAGPLKGLVTEHTVVVLPSAVSDEGNAKAVQEEGRRRREESPWEEAHEVLANLTLALVVAHILGVILASMVHHENLARAMVTGRKRV